MKGTLPFSLETEVSNLCSDFSNLITFPSHASPSLSVYLCLCACAHAQVCVMNVMNTFTKWFYPSVFWGSSLDGCVHFMGSPCILPQWKYEHPWDPKWFGWEVSLEGNSVVSHRFEEFWQQHWGDVGLQSQIRKSSCIRHNNFTSTLPLSSSSMGYCVLVAHGLGRLCSLMGRWGTTVLSISMLLLLLLFSWKTVQQNHVWLSREALFR